MATANRLQLLPGKRRLPLSEHFTLLGEDHLVLVRRVGYRESYRRVELADIEAVATTPTTAMQRTAIVLATVAATLAALAALAGGGFRIFWLAVAGAVVLALTLHLLRGPTCRVYLRTPLDWIEVPSLHRVRIAERVLARLGERLNELQGELGETRQRELLASVAPPLADEGAARAAVAFATAVRAPGASAPRRPVDRRAHTALAAATALHLAVSLAQSRWESRGIDLVGAVAMLGLVVLAVVAVVRQLGSDLPRPLRRWATGTLVALTLGFVLSAYVATIGSAILEIRQGGPPPTAGFSPVARGGLRTALAMAAAALDGGVLVAWLLVRSARGGVRREDAA